MESVFRRLVMKLGRTNIAKDESRLSVVLTPARDKRHNDTQQVTLLPGSITGPHA